MNSGIKALTQIEDLQKQLEELRKSFNEKEAKIKLECKEKISNLKEQFKENEKKILDKISKLEQGTAKANALVVAKLIDALGSENVSKSMSKEIMQHFSGDSLDYLNKLVKTKKAEKKVEKNVEENNQEELITDEGDDNEIDVDENADERM